MKNYPDEHAKAKLYQQQFIFDGILGSPRAVIFIFNERAKLNKRYHELYP